MLDYYRNQTRKENIFFSYMFNSKIQNHKYNYASKYNITEFVTTIINNISTIEPCGQKNPIMGH